MTVARPGVACLAPSASGLRASRVAPRLPIPHPAAERRQRPLSHASRLLSSKPVPIFVARATEDAPGYVEKEGLDLSKISFGSIAAPVGVTLLVYGFGAYISLLPGESLSALMLIYGFPISLIGFALKYAELAPVECKTTAAALALRETQMTDIQKQVREDTTRYRYASPCPTTLLRSGEGEQECSSNHSNALWEIATLHCCNGCDGEGLTDNHHRAGMAMSSTWMRRCPASSSLAALMGSPAGKPLRLWVSGRK